MSFTDPVPTELASQHIPKTKFPGTAQTCPRTSRLLQLHPVMSINAQTTQDPSKAVLDLLECLGKPGKVQGFWKTVQNTQYIGLGYHHGFHKPLDMWHMYIPRKPGENHLEHSGLARNKPDSTGQNSTSPKCAPGNHLPLGKPVNHDYRIEHQRAPLSH